MTSDSDSRPERGSTIPIAGPRAGCRRDGRHGARGACADPRWPQIVAALAALRERHRRAVRIVDADCACGTLLIAAARHAHAAGFTGIEARGIHRSPTLIGRARAAAARLHDPAIGVVFERAEAQQALAAEADFPADIVLWHDAGPAGESAGVRAAVAAAGRWIIGDPAPDAGGRRA
ncbi:SAM-dependent methyltransferase [Sphingomonas kyungheensis]|uniref:SAM-dependent methyltransferase n=1 Tax=Sphingomonas kyungheensis TaxID=1069987 RepID=A0ABU8H6W1_9SPHN